MNTAGRPGILREARGSWKCRQEFGREWSAIVFGVDILAGNDLSYLHMTIISSRLRVTFFDKPHSIFHSFPPIYVPPLLWYPVLYLQRFWNLIYSLNLSDCWLLKMSCWRLSDWNSQLLQRIIFMNCLEWADLSSRVLYFRLLIDNIINS